MAFKTLLEYQELAAEILDQSLALTNPKKLRPRIV